MSDESRTTRDEELIQLGKRTAVVAHEMRNFMTAILAGAEYLCHHDDPVVQETARRILGSANHCRAYTTQLLGKLQDCNEPTEFIDLARLLQDYVEGRRGAATLSFASHHSEPMVILGHRTRLTSVFENLIRNAEEAALPDRAVVSIDLEAANEHVIATVHDSGPGIPEAQHDRLFEEFSTAGKEGGTGIGLPLCRNIIEEHQGTIAHVDRSTPGTTFQIRLPLAGEIIHEAASSERDADAPLTGLKILCIDDDQNTLATYRMILGLDDHQVVSAALGEEGLEMAATDTFDVIICDYRLPDMDGKQFQERLSALPGEFERLLLFATGDLMNQESRAFLEKTQCPFLVKPFEIDELRNALQDVVSGSKK